MQDLINNFWNIIFVFFGILGILSSYYFYKKSRKLKKPVYFQNSVNLIKNNLPKLSNLELLYKGEQINNFTITYLGFWNAGNETINNNDIASVNAQILEFEVMIANNNANNFIVKLNETTNCIEITFDYIDKNDGLVLKIYHTGNTSSDLVLTGSIRGVKSFILKYINPHDVGSSLLQRMIFSAIMAVPLLLLFLASNNFNLYKSLLLTGVVLFLGLIFFVYTRKKVPDGFEIISKEFMQFHI
jgi:hypothetical protein